MDTIQRLVNYFEVPLSFLLDDSSGLTIQPQTNIIIQNKAGIFASDQSHEDPEIFDMISALSPENRATIKRVIRMAYLSEKANRSSLFQD